MDHTMRENIYDELNNFEKKKPAEISVILDDYLALIGKTGDIIFPWAKLKPLFKYKLDQVIQKFYEDYPAKDLPYSPNIDKFNFDNMHSKLLNAVEEFTGAPFTIQRLCELVVCPDKHYKRVDKFMRALEKDLLVVSTIEPLCKRQRTDSETSSLVNGVTETASSLNGSAQSPQSTHSNEEPNVESTAEPDDAETHENHTLATEGEKLDCESEAEANDAEANDVEPLKDENEQMAVPSDTMDTIVSSSSAPDTNDSPPPEQKKARIENDDDDAEVKSTQECGDRAPSPTSEPEKIEAQPSESNSETIPDVEKTEQKDDNEKQITVEDSTESEISADQVACDCIDEQPETSCSEDASESLPAASSEAEVRPDESIGANETPESSAPEVPDSPSQSLDSALGTVSPEAAPQSTSTPVSTTSTEMTVSDENAQMEPEPMEAE